MNNDINFNLTEADNQFVMRIEKSINRKKLFYVAICLSFIADISQMMSGTIYKQPERYCISLIWIIICIQGILISYLFKRFYSIITKLKCRIIELEDEL